MSNLAESTLPTTCVVGAGPSGLAMARALLAKGLPVEVYERHTSIGGLWDPDNTGTPLYESAHFISSKTLSGFPGYPMPDDFPDYPRGDQILSYLRAFSKEYGLDRVITTGCGVKSAVWSDDHWEVELENGQARNFDNLVCANGTQWHPSMPDIDGEFSGEIFHSLDYSSIDQIRSKRVLVIGAGNSGVDIACDAASSASLSDISMRRGYHFIPKHIFGVPSDVFAETGPELPMAISQRVFARMLRLLVGKQEKLGLPKPDHKIFETHPILNTEIFHYLSHGDLGVKPDVARFDGSTVHFIDGTSADYDVVICATGYTTKVPYLDDSNFTWRMGRPDMLIRVFERTNPHLFAVGFAEGDGGGFRIFDMMADAIANTVVKLASGSDSERDEWQAFLKTATPSIKGDAKLIDVPRHAAYIHYSAFVQEMAAIREQFGWDDLADTEYDQLKS